MPTLSVLEMAGVLGAGVVAGTVNTVVGSGSLLTFPALLAFGYSPLVANVTNSVGLTPGVISGAIGYRRELIGQRPRVRRLGVAAIAGGLLGAALLLALPGSSFEKAVPFLVLLAVALVIAQPRLAARVAARQLARDDPGRQEPLLDVLVFLTAIYGGYFGGGQGVIFIALLGIFVQDQLHRINALRNVVAGLVNGVGSLLFVVFAAVAWLPVALLAVGATVGGQVGARYGRHLSPAMMRIVIIVVGVTIAVKLFLDW